MKEKTITVIVLLGVTGALIVFDIYLYFNEPKPSMITSVVWETAKQHPVLPFLVGFVCGHLFWGRGDTD